VIGYAKAVFMGTMTPGYIRDMSRTGCNIAFILPVPVAMGDLIEIKVIAAHDPTLLPFQLYLRVRWVKGDPLWFSLGGEIETVSNHEGGDFFERLVAYYEGKDS